MTTFRHRSGVRAGHHLCRAILTTLITALILARSVAPAAAGGPPATIYVDVNAAGNDTGLSWTDAKTDLQDALDMAPAGVEILVAEGTYRPSEPAGRDATFLLEDGVELYGGFPTGGGDGTFEARDPLMYETILSGDLGTAGDTSDNAYHVVTVAPDATAAALLDGFTITGGNADGSGPTGAGGGIYNANGDPTLRRLVIRRNRAAFGGGMENDSGEPTLTAVIFAGNVASDDGGGLDTIGGVVRITSAVFVGNQADDGGALSAITGGSVELANTTLVGNAANRGVLYTSNGTLEAVNTILWGNTGAATYSAGGPIAFTGSIVESGCPAGATCTGVTSEDPHLFVTPSAGDDATWGTADDAYGDQRLEPGSPALDAGNNAAVPAGVTIDVAGNPRFVNAPNTTRLAAAAVDMVDLGAYEAPVARLHVDGSATGTGDGLSWTNAYTDLQEALRWSRSGPTEVWVAEGIYRPGLARTSTFQLYSGVKVYGGFPEGGGGGSFTDRDPALYATQLTGRLNNGLFAYHVVTARSTDATARLDGLTIQRGRADATGDDIGGGVLSERSDLTLHDVHLWDNEAEVGGGMAILGGAPTLTEVGFTSNAATDAGGLYVEEGNPRLDHVTFTRNEADYGGAMATIRDASPAMSNVAFRSNSATHRGGAAYLAGGSPQIINALFIGNQAETGGALYSYMANPLAIVNSTFAANEATTKGGGITLDKAKAAVNNAIFWDNSASSHNAVALTFESSATVRYSIVADSCPIGATCTAVTSDNPSFVREPDPGTDGVWGSFDDDHGDVRLEPDSPAVDAGDNSALILLTTEDTAGNARQVDLPDAVDTGNGTAPIIDLGPYETPPATLYVDAAAQGTATGLTWTDAFTTVQDALRWTHSGPAEIRIAAGTYAPGNNRGDAFELTNQVKLLGGFPSGGGSGADRDAQANPTILSGEIGDPGSVEDNVYNVVRIAAGSPLRGGTAVEGLTIRGGYGVDAPLEYVSGGGLSLGQQALLTLTDVQITDNAARQGGGMRMSGGTLTLLGVTFARNRASFVGGGMQQTTGSVMMVNARFEMNHCDLQGGGLIVEGGGTTTIGNGVFVGNSAAAAGAIEAGGNLGLVNTTVVSNTGGGIHHRSGDLTVRNSVIWDNETYQVDAADGGTVEDGLIGGGCPAGMTCTRVRETDPGFRRDPAMGSAGWGSPGSDAGDLVPGSGSPLIDAGNNAWVTDTPVDVLGHPRRIDVGTVPDTGIGTAPVVDIGAYEALNATYLPLILR